MSGQKFTGIAGLPISRRAVRILKDGGIYAHALLSVEHQELAKRYVIRGLESGGSVGDVGRYVTFADEDGEPLEYLHPVETIAVNGLHAVVLSKAMLRADMLRKGRTYELLITRVEKTVIGEHFFLLLPALTILWVNLHGGFFVGITLLMGYGFGTVTGELIEVCAHGRRVQTGPRSSPSIE